MASVEITISGVLYDKYSKTTRPVVLIGEASLTGVGVGGGPIIPDGGEQPGAPGSPAFPIWGPPGSNFPDKPGYPPVVGGGPIYPPNVPPDMQPPIPPVPGDPTKPVPPPAGSGGWPVNPITPPTYLVVNYPGIGPVYVAPPMTAQPKK